MDSRARGQEAAPQTARTERRTPRRKPRLRVVSHSLPTNRHARPWLFMNIWHIVEVYTFAEWAKLEPRERPQEYGILPWIGYFTAELPMSNQELQDVQDLCRQETEGMGLD